MIAPVTSPLACGSQFMIESLLNNEPNPEQEELIWKVSQEGYQLFSVEGKLTIGQLLPLAATWKGNPGFLGWDTVSNSLPKEFRAKMAYLFGLRYLLLSRPEDAKKFFMTAVKDSLPDSLCAKLASAELAKVDTVK